MLDEDDLWALMHEAVDDWKAVIGLKREDSVLAVTHVDHCPGNPNALVRICLSLEERELFRGKRRKGMTDDA